MTVAPQEEKKIESDDESKVEIRVRIQGSEAESFERLCRRFGVSDGLMRAMGHAFDAHARYSDQGKTIGVTPVEVILSLIELANPAIANTADVGMAEILRRKCGSLASESIVARDAIYSTVVSSQATGVSPSPALISTLSSARRLSNYVSDGKSLAIRHFVAAYLMEGLFKRDEVTLSKLGLNVDLMLQGIEEHISTQPTDDPNAWRSSLALAGTAPYQPAKVVGEAAQISREASDREIGLGVDTYASVLAQLFKDARGEFCFGLFGPWGRGKTVLAQRLAKALREGNPGTQIVWFSAWKFPTIPEVWVHLYETFADQAFGRPSWRNLPNVFRASVARGGYTKLIWIYLGFSTSLLSLLTAATVAVDTTFKIASLIGIAGIALVFTTAKSILNTKQLLFKDYLTQTRHAEKLGLQSVIGKDLACLLSGWVDPTRPKLHIKVTLLLITALGMLACAHRVYQESPVLSAFEQHLGIGSLLISGPILAIIVCVLFATAAALLYRFLIYGGSPPSRVLLIVDDLDRCNPEYLVSVVESVKLLVEDPKISKKLQVVMLVEEDIFDAAVVRKYRDAIPSMTDSIDSTLVRWRVIQETKEKLFTSHFRLPPLTRHDLISLIEQFTGFSDMQNLQTSLVGEANAELARLEKTEIPREIMIKPGKPGHPYMRGVPRAEIPPEPATPPSPPEYKRRSEREIQTDQQDLANRIEKARERASAELLGLKEYERINGKKTRSDVRPSAVPTAAGAFQVTELEAIFSVIENTTGLRTHLGPRTVRTLLFRYQLARMMLQAAGTSWSPRGIAEHLAKRMLYPKPVISVDYEGVDEHYDEFARIIDQVC